MRSTRWLAWLWMMLHTLAAHAWRDPLQDVPTLPYRIVETQPHDTKLFTQGFVQHGDQWIESSGNYAHARLVVREPRKTEPVRALRLPGKWFAEGIAIHNNILYLLTWQEGIAQTYSLPALQPLQRFRYSGEGWGLTSNRTHLIQSDGSPTLIWRDPADFRETHRISVTVNDQALDRLNELEWVDGWILANVWLSEWIVGIDPVTGRVAFTISLQGLLKERDKPHADVANGIAWDPKRKLLWVTGKYWPHVFGLQLTLPTARAIE
jgi:glutaminyl-peptide cyclotransferase